MSKKIYETFYMFDRKCLYNHVARSNIWLISILLGFDLFSRPQRMMTFWSGLKGFLASEACANGKRLMKLLTRFAIVKDK